MKLFGCSTYHIINKWLFHCRQPTQDKPLYDNIVSKTRTHSVCAWENIISAYVCRTCMCFAHCLTAFDQCFSRLTHFKWLQLLILRCLPLLLVAIERSLLLTTRKYSTIPYRFLMWRVALIDFLPPACLPFFTFHAYSTCSIHWNQNETTKTN